MATASPYAKHITDEAIAKNAAHLIASIYMELGDSGVAALPPKTREGIEALRAELDASYYLEPFKREDGTLSVW